MRNLFLGMVLLSSGAAFAQSNSPQGASEFYGAMLDGNTVAVTVYSSGSDGTSNVKGSFALSKKDWDTFSQAVSKAGFETKVGEPEPISTGCGSNSAKGLRLPCPS